MSLEINTSNWLSALSTLNGTATTAKNTNPFQGVDVTDKEAVKKAATDQLKLSKYGALGLVGSSSKVQTSYTPATAAEAAANGAATHSFLFHDIDSLAQIAADPEQTLDTSFARDTLDFFTGGSYTDAEVDALQSQMQTALEELAKQVEETGSVDPTKLTSRMTIGGVEMSLRDLADFQTMGQKLAPVFDGIQEDNTRFEDMQCAAKMAVGRRLGQMYGQDRGEAGALFSAAMDRLYEKGMDKVNQYYTDSADATSAYVSDSNQLRSQISDMFSNLSTTNQSSMTYDFNQKLSTMKNMLGQHYSSYGIPAAYRSASEADKNVGLFYSSISRLL